MKMCSHKCALLAGLVVLATVPCKAQEAVRLTERTTTIPTYEVLPPDPNPIFFNGRRYQGAQGRVYPYALNDRLTDNRIDKEYTEIILENEYIEVSILPEMGGRILYAKDKTNGYYFIYYNRVIKPALIGMNGAWISGGVEWNIPHHHRASSFLPVDYTTEEHEDGSKTVWVGETEWRHRTRWIVGLTLHPAKAYVEATVRHFNTAPVKNSMLVFANAAVHTNENYQVTFPPRTQYATYHKKSEFTQWPVSNQYYNGADYSDGVDVSWWKNHPKSTSFFAWEPMGNFVAGYDHGARSGTVVFGDPYSNPGKKVWSWGNNPSGLLWSDLLTDDDGPYIELMFGAYSDNQPDYSWTHPSEMRETKMFFAPLREIGGVKASNQNGSLNLVADENAIEIGVHTLSPQQDARIILTKDDAVLLSETASIDPATPWSRRVVLDGTVDPVGMTLRLVSADGTGLISYSVLSLGGSPMPIPVKQPRRPDAVASADSLFFIGLRLEQFHEPQLFPEDYYRAALERDENHFQARLHLGILRYRQWRYEEALEHLLRAVERETRDYTWAEDAEAHYYSGLTFLRLGRKSEAAEHFHRAVWDFEWRAPANYQLALIESNEGHLERALDFADAALVTNAHYVQALALKATLFRTTGKPDEARKTVRTLTDLDPLNYYAERELSLLVDQGVPRTFGGDESQSLIEMAVQYGAAGFYVDASEILSAIPITDRNAVQEYLLGYFLEQVGGQDSAGAAFVRASRSTTEYSFPFRHETIAALQSALVRNPDDGLAHYLLGNLYYEKLPETAIEHWATSIDLEPARAVVHRNMAFAHLNQARKPEEALRSITEAIRLNPNEPRYYYELDTYYRAIRGTPDVRMAAMEGKERLLVRYGITLQPYTILRVLTGDYDRAIELMETHHYRRWEGEGSIYDYWIYAHLLGAADDLIAGRTDRALTAIEAVDEYPINLETISSPLSALRHFLSGLAAEQAGQISEAETAYSLMAESRSGQPEVRFYRARAVAKLGRSDEADELFSTLINDGERQLIADAQLDFFNPFARIESEFDRKARGYYLIALGHLGLGQMEEATEAWSEALEWNPSMMGFPIRMERLLGAR